MGGSSRQRLGQSTVIVHNGHIMAVIIDDNEATKYTIVVIRVATFRSSQTRHPNTPSFCWMTCQIVKCKLRLIHESKRQFFSRITSRKKKRKRKRQQKQKELSICRIDLNLNVIRLYLKYTSAHTYLINHIRVDSKESRRDFLRRIHFCASIDNEFDKGSASNLLILKILKRY